MDWKRKLSSRKLWGMIANFIGMLLYAFGAAQTSVERITALIIAGGGIIAYIIGESAIDAASLGSTIIAEEPANSPTIVHGFVVPDETEEDEDE